MPAALEEGLMGRLLSTILTTEAEQATIYIVTLDASLSECHAVIDFHGGTLVFDGAVWCALHNSVTAKVLTFFGKNEAAEDFTGDKDSRAGICNVTVQYAVPWQTQKINFMYQLNW